MVWLLAVAAAITAAGVILKALLALRRSWLRGERVLDDLLGTPAVGSDPSVPSLRHRLDKVAADVHEVKGALPSVAVGLSELADRIAEVKALAVGTDARVTEHRRRNEEYAAALREELKRRDGVVDDKLAHLSDDLLRAETYRASLLELGLPITPPRGPQ